MLLSLCRFVVGNKLPNFATKQKPLSAFVVSALIGDTPQQHFAYRLACPSVCLRSKVQYVQTAPLLVPYQPRLLAALPRTLPKFTQVVTNCCKTPEQKRRVLGRKLWQSRSLPLAVLPVTWTLHFRRMIWKKIKMNNLPCETLAKLWFRYHIAPPVVLNG